MITKMKPRNPEKIEMTLEVTMSIREWKQFRGQIQEGNQFSYPSNTMLRHIETLIDKAEQEFESNEETQ